MELKSLKRDFGVEVHTPSFHRGDAIYYLDLSSHLGRCGKLKPVWLGSDLLIVVLAPYTSKMGERQGRGEQSWRPRTYWDIVATLSREGVNRNRWGQ